MYYLETHTQKFFSQTEVMSSVNDLFKGKKYSLAKLAVISIYTILLIEIKYVIFKRKAVKQYFLPFVRWL